MVVLLRRGRFLSVVDGLRDKKFEVVAHSQCNGVTVTPHAKSRTYSQFKLGPRARRRPRPGALAARLRDDHVLPAAPPPPPLFGAEDVQVFRDKWDVYRYRREHGVASGVG